MKYINQLLIILGISFVGEVLHALLPLPVPASVYGLLLLLFLLMTKIVKLSQVEETAGYMLSIMALFFIEPSVALMNSFDTIKGKVVPILAASFISFAAVNIVTGLTSQGVIRWKKRKEKKDDTK